MPPKAGFGGPHEVPWRHEPAVYYPVILQACRHPQKPRGPEAHAVILVSDAQGSTRSTLLGIRVHWSCLGARRSRLQLNQMKSSCKVHAMESWCRVPRARRRRGAGQPDVAQAEQVTYLTPDWRAGASCQRPRLPKSSVQSVNRADVT